MMSLVYCAIYAQLPVSRIEFTANPVCSCPSLDSERARDQWQCADVTPQVNLSFSFVSCVSKHFIEFIAIRELTITVRQAAVAAQRTMTFQYGRPLERHSYRQVLKSF